MTYLDKIMEAVKFDNELLTREEIRTLRACIRDGIYNNARPWDFSFVIADIPTDWIEREEWIEKKRVPRSREAWDVSFDTAILPPKAKAQTWKNEKATL